MIVYTSNDLPQRIFDLPIKKCTAVLKYEDESPVQVINILVVYQPFLVYELLFHKFIKKSVYEIIEDMIPDDFLYRIVIRVYINILGFKIQLNETFRT